MSSTSLWDTKIKARGMKFHLEWDAASKQTKLYGPMATGHSWEGPLIVKFKCNDFCEAMKKAEQFVEMRFK